jgi:hypothetical protein
MMFVIINSLPGAYYNSQYNHDEFPHPPANLPW